MSGWGDRLTLEERGIAIYAHGLKNAQRQYQYDESR